MQKITEKNKKTRREFLRDITLAGAGIAFSPALLNFYSKRVTASENSANGFITENAFIVVIDGLRMEEAFDADDPTAYIPHIWNELRPQGTVLESFYNNRLTLTRSGHSSMLTGVWDYGIQNRSYSQPKEPTIFEYYRKQLQVPKSKAWFISGRMTLHQEGFSNYPDYGLKYGASWEIVPGADADDSVVWNRARSIMARDQPSLFMINFPAVDHIGHLGDWHNYVGAIRNVDEIVYNLWEIIQNFRYKEKTTMFLVTDHGRHDATHGGFPHHWCNCLGCRKLMFLALGPDIKENTVISTPYEGIDIASTVGALLGFDTPLAQGRIMEDIFVNPPGATTKIFMGDTDSEYSIPNVQSTNYPSRSIKPVLATDSNGHLHLVWMDDRDGNWQIYYSTSTDNGQTWSDESRISTWSTYCYEPALIVDAQNNIHIFWEGYPYGIEGAENGEGGSRLFYWNSTLPAEVNLFQDLWAISPDIAIGTDGKIHLVFAGKVNNLGPRPVLYSDLYYSYSMDNGRNWSSPKMLVSPAQYVMELPDGTDLFSDYGTDRTAKLQSALSPKISVDSGVLNVAWLDCLSANAIHGYICNWDIYGIRSVDNGVTWSLPQKISTHKKLSFDPDLTLVDGQPFYVWSDNRSGHWEILRDGETQISDSGVNVWSPSVDSEVVAWTDYRNGNPEIYVKDSDKPSARVTFDLNFSVYPSVVATEQHIHVAWCDNRTGNWEIYYQRLER